MKQHPKFEKLVLSVEGEAFYDGVKLNINDNGYGYKTVKVRGDKNQYVHRLVAQTYLENPENKPQVGHKDHNKENNHLDNLYWCTQKENTADGIAANRINAKKRGTTNKVGALDYYLIALAKKLDIGVNDTAKAISLPRTTVSSVLNNRSYPILFDSVCSVLEGLCKDEASWRYTQGLKLVSR